MIRTLDERTSVSGQIEPADVPALKDSGVSMIICNRPDGEEPGQPSAAEVERAATALGLDFRLVPVVRGIGPSDVEAMQEALEAAHGKVHIYCRSGNRSSLLWAVARRKQGADPVEIRRAVTQAGYDVSAIDHLL